MSYVITLLLRKKSTINNIDSVDDTCNLIDLNKSSTCNEFLTPASVITKTKQVFMQDQKVEINSETATGGVL